MITPQVAGWLGAAFIVVGFAWALSKLGLVGVAGRAANTARHSLAVLRDPALGDDAKEAAMQADAKALFGAFVHLAAGLAAALLAPMAIVWLLGRAGLVDFDAVIAVSLTWPFLLGGLIVFIIVLMRPGQR